MLKEIIRTFVGEPAWFELTKFKKEFRHRKQVEFWDPDLGRILKEILPEKGFYVDVGAHDGRSSSNTFNLEKQGWTGVLIEPILSKYFRIRQLRSLLSNKVFHAACVPNSFSKESVSMIYADLMSFSDEFSVVDQPAWIAGSEEFFNSNEISVRTFSPARTLDSILYEAKAPKVIEFLSIDVEGAEKAVLSGLNLCEFAFKVICVEAQDESEISIIFSHSDYELFAQVKNNYLFVNRAFAL
jgi:FkbM family methyltransferase